MHIFWIPLKDNRYERLFNLLVQSFAFLVLYACLSGPAFAIAPRDGVSEKTLDGVQYKFPNAYLAYPEGTKDTDVLIGAVFPSFDPPAEVFDPAKEGNKQVVILVMSNSPSTVAFRLKVHEERWGPLQPEGTKYGLPFFIGSKGPRQFGAGLKLPKEKILEELYVNEDDKNSPYFIDCDADLAVPNPSCQMVFENSGLIYQITFNKKLLPDWQTIKESSVGLMSKFVDQDASPPS